MTYRMMPCVSLWTILKEVQKEYEEVSFDRLKDILWFARPANDCYKEYYFGDGPIVECDVRNKIENYVIALLEKQFPEYDTVLIDVSW